MTEPTVDLSAAYEVVQAAEKSVAQSIVAKINAFHDDIHALAASLPPQAGNSHVMQQIGTITSYLYSFESIRDSLNANYAPVAEAEGEAGEP